MRDGTAKALSAFHTVLYRATGGRVGRRLVHNDMLLLTTTGRRTGRPHTVPLLYLTDTDGTLIVIASWGGRPVDPEWYQNLVVDSSVTVELPGRRFAANATTVRPEERAEWWPRIVDAYDGYATYQSRTDRQIPVVRLTPI